MTPGPRRAAVLAPGKLPAPLLARLLKRYARLDSRVVLGPGVGEDAAAISMGRGRPLLVAKSDPITFLAEDISRYALIVNANDIATRGAEPRWFLGTLLLPEGKATAADAERHFRQLSAACGELGVSMVGGHVEVTLGLGRPLLAGTLLGEVPPGGLLATRDARPGDDVVLTKGAAIEAVSVLARSKARELSRTFPRAFLARCRAFLKRLSVVGEARLARALGCRAMHDPTEGGVATALHELADAAGIGLEAYAEGLPAPPEARALCRHFGLDPLGCLASGALLIAIPPSKTLALIKALRRAGIPAWRAARATPRGHGVWLAGPEGRRPLPRYDQDEITRVL